MSMPHFPPSTPTSTTPRRCVLPPSGVAEIVTTSLVIDFVTPFPSVANSWYLDCPNCVRGRESGWVGIILKRDITDVGCFVFQWIRHEKLNYPEHKVRSWRDSRVVASANGSQTVSFLGMCTSVVHSLAVHEQKWCCCLSVDKEAYRIVQHPHQYDFWLIETACEWFSKRNMSEGLCARYTQSRCFSVSCVYF